MAKTEMNVLLIAHTKLSEKYVEQMKGLLKDHSPKEEYAGSEINGDDSIAVLNALGYDAHSGGKTYKAGDSDV